MSSRNTYSGRQNGMFFVLIRRFCRWWVSFSVYIFNILYSLRSHMHFSKLSQLKRPQHSVIQYLHSKQWSQSGKKWRLPCLRTPESLMPGLINSKITVTEPPTLPLMFSQWVSKVWSPKNSVRNWLCSVINPTYKLEWYRHNLPHKLEWARTFFMTEVHFKSHDICTNLIVFYSSRRRTQHGQWTHQRGDVRALLTIPMMITIMKWLRFRFRWWFCKSKCSSRPWAYRNLCRRS